MDKKKEIIDKEEIKMFGCFGKIWNYYSLFKPNYKRYSNILKIKNYHLFLNNENEILSLSKNNFGFIYFVDDEVTFYNKMNLRKIIDKNLEKNFKKKIMIVFLNKDKKIIENLKIEINNIIKENTIDFFFIEEKFENEKSDLINFLDNLK